MFMSHVTRVLGSECLMFEQQALLFASAAPNTPMAMPWMPFRGAIFQGGAESRDHGAGSDFASPLTVAGSRQP